MDTIHISEALEKQYGENIRHYLFLHTINDKNFLPAKITQLAMDLYFEFINDNHPTKDVYKINEGNCKTRIQKLLKSDSYIKEVEKIHLNYTCGALNSILGTFSAPPAKNNYPHYSYAQTVTATTYLLTLANQNIKADTNTLNNLANNCHRLLSYRTWLERTLLHMFASVTEYFRGELCCGNSEAFTSSILNWFDYLDILEFRILPHACSIAFKKFECDNFQSGKTKRITSIQKKNTSKRNV